MLTKLEEHYPNISQNTAPQNCKLSGVFWYIVNYYKCYYIQKFANVP